ncbi:MAG: phage Gp37/Gp68 family protein [Elusimicrobia bacterium]|nr:phage Gp37/Gp68 family protein [Elusimicrobiota bacterium]
MSQNSAIEWTEATWNPVTGCTKTSEGCLHCYAERLARRLRAMGQPNYKNGFRLTTHPNSLEIPLRWKKPHLIFVNSMSDLFHKDVPVKFILDIFRVMNESPRHRFMILTKRSERLLCMSHKLPWAGNILMGVTVENEKYLYRLEHLKKTGAKTKFVCLEPLLGPLPRLNLKGIGWVIVGGESGPGARPIKPEWVTGIRDICLNSKVPFFFKQWGGTNKKKAGRTLNGQTYIQRPEALSAASRPQY